MEMPSSRWTVVSIFVWAFAVGLTVGCGTIDNGSPGEAGQAPSSSVSSVEEDTSTEAGDDVAQFVPAAVEMSVFSRPRAEADVLPSELSYQLGKFECSDTRDVLGGCLGDSVGDESRLLLSGLGVRETNLYAWPTTNDGVCFAWGAGGGGCVLHFTERASQRGARPVFIGIDPDHEGVGAPGTLVGVVPDDVVAVDVLVAGIRHAAVLQNNGLFYELPRGSCTNRAFESLTATYRDGTSDTVPIEWGHGPKTLPETCRG